MVKIIDFLPKGSFTRAGARAFLGFEGYLTAPSEFYGTNRHLQVARRLPDGVVILIWKVWFVSAFALRHPPRGPRGPGASFDTPSLPKCCVD